MCLKVVQRNLGEDAGLHYELVIADEYFKPYLTTADYDRLRIDCLNHFKKCLGHAEKIYKISSRRDRIYLKFSAFLTDETRELGRSGALFHTAKEKYHGLTQYVDTVILDFKKFSNKLHDDSSSVLWQKTGNYILSIQLSGLERCESFNKDSDLEFLAQDSLILNYEKGIYPYMSQIYGKFDNLGQPTFSFLVVNKEKGVVEVKYDNPRLYIRAF
jgi:hypothetical protein